VREAPAALASPLTHARAPSNAAVEIDAALRKAGGANYDLGNTNSGVQAGGTTVRRASFHLRGWPG
jgi:hypothetical protein